MSAVGPGSAGSPGRRRTRRAFLGFAGALVWLTVLVGGALGADPAPGPPFPAQVPGQWVYDYAHIWSQSAIDQAETIIKAIEDRTGAQVVVYSQSVDDGGSQKLADSRAIALGTQWGIGRKGFNDGFVMLFDIDSSGQHGQVAQVGGDGFQNAYYSDAAGQKTFDEQMKPALLAGDFDGAMLAGLRAVDSAATPAHATFLQAARVVNAIIGIVVAPIVGLLLIAWPFLHWLRYGRDPVYIDDPSILMPAPPADLTAATGALVFDGSSSRRTLTTALLDLASRGRLAFDEHHHFLSKKLSIRIDPGPPADEVAAAHQRLADRRPLGAAETYALGELRVLASDGVLEGDDLLAFGKKTGKFDELLEAGAVQRGWFGRAPTRVRNRWIGQAVVVLVLAGVAAWIGVSMPMSGLLVVAGAMAFAGLATFALAFVMPARTMAGATIRAMLAAYRRTLEKTMAQARSMTQVVAEAGLGWIETPDQALVWSTALGLQGDVEKVLERSREDVEAGRQDRGTAWFPVWWGAGAGAGGGSGGPGGGGSVFSGSAIPSIGGMMAALGTIGNSPSSHGGGGGVGGGGGGFSGGSGGGF